MSEDRHRFPISNKGEGEEFCTDLVSSTEFGPLLTKLGGKGSKAESVETVVDAIISGDLEPKDVLLEFCKLPRTWLCVAATDHFEPSAEGGDAGDFLKKFGSTNWYGPYYDDADSGEEWWVFSKPIVHEVLESSFGDDRTYTKLAYRWHVIVHLEQREDIEKCIVSLHWFGLNHDERTVNEQGDPGPIKSQQFDYWKHIPTILETFPTMAAADEVPPAKPRQLHKLVLHDLMDKYEGDPDFKWEHLKVRAESDGIAMNTTSSPKRGAEIEIAGIRQLTSTLAKSVLQSFVLETSSEEEKAENESIVERALLRTLVREWGTRGYEFKMDWEDSAIRGYFFFGGHEKGPDSLTHIKTYKHEGWSTRMRKFVVKHLWP